MKNLYNTILVIFLVQTISFAQKDSVLYITPLEEAFMIDKETKSLFKVKRFLSSYPGLKRGYREIGDAINISLAFEQKIRNGFSISPFVDLDYSDTYRTLGLGLEFRYYYKLAKLIKEQKQANNLSSNYFAVSYQKTAETICSGPKTLYGDQFKNDVPNIRSIFQDGTNIFELSYGVQKRFMNYGYLDFRVNLGRNSGRYYSHSYFYLSSQTNIGIGLGKNYKYSEEAICPIFKCFSNRKSALKINFNKNWTLTVSQSSLLLSLSPNIIHEIKIGSSPISFEQDLESSILFAGGTPFLAQTFGVNNFGFKYRAGFKYYHRMKSRIRNGKSGNNLAGFYIFGRGEYQFVKILSRDFQPGSQQPAKLIRQNVQLGYGYQKEVVKNMFFDINLGFFTDVGKQQLIANAPSLGVTTDVKVGLMF